MKTKLAITSFLLSTLLLPVIAYSADTDIDRSYAKSYVKDSVITTKIKSKLAAESLASTTHIKVDTDNNGVVWLRGTAKSQAEIDQIISIAEKTVGVSAVKNHIKVKVDD